MRQVTFLIFTGHNDRAVVALCRFFSLHHIPFVLVASADEPINVTANWRERIILKRSTKAVNLALFQEVVAAYQTSHTAYSELIYCPTTEFINEFILQHRTAIDGMGIKISLPSKDVYARLTNKESSIAFTKSAISISAPPLLDWSELRVPCVLKPKQNVSRGVVQYPQICLTKEAVTTALENVQPDEWFAQAFVEGQSFYLCAYLNQNGEFTYFWQINLLQQPDGKSIVLARTCRNPGVDAEKLLHALHEAGFRGPLMMEVIQEVKTNTFHFIEFNPRFWGPLQLALDACPDVLRLFVNDAGGIDLPAVPMDLTTREHWYAWAAGADMPNCKRYPALDNMSQQALADLLTQHDVFARSY